jgi:exopolysaccharide production protein ExoY
MHADSTTRIYSDATYADAVLSDGIDRNLISSAVDSPVRLIRPARRFLRRVRAVLRPLIKRGFDMTVAASLLVLLAPLMLALASLIRRDGGSAFFGHQRMGVGGQPFRCLKFRSMHMDSQRLLHEYLEASPAAAEEWAAARKLRNDPRVTRLGHVLRSTSLDELPQLINVLRGDMSLVGPRPIVADERQYYGRHIERYYAVRPGVTGLWQVSGRSGTSYARRVQLDVRYVTRHSLRLDAWILLRTIPAVLVRRGAV